MAGRYETVVGMEVHVELMTETKVFCGCSTRFGRPPNTQVCPVCLGMPGSLPVLNRKAFEFALRTALALGCDIAPRAQFERKNYYYPDLPKNYQISQLRKNLGTGGGIDIHLGGATKRIRMDNIHLEEDAGKNIHPDAPGADYSLVDLNRTGTPLLEIVTQPDIRSAAEAAAYMQALQTMLEYIEVSDCNLHEGRMRFEPNISVRPVGEEKLGTKVEVKNLASFKIVRQCIEYETARQIDVIEGGGQVDQETRSWDEDAGRTRIMRSKEEAHDYRYFPDPDLVEIVVDQPWLDRIRAELPELPGARKKRLVDQYSLPEYDAGVLTASKPVVEYFEAAVNAHDNAKSISNWIMTEVMRFIGEGEGAQSLGDFPIKPEQLASLIKLIDDDTINGKIAKDVFKDMLAGEGDPAEIVERKGLAQITDTGDLERSVDEVLAANEKVVEDYRGGKDKAMSFLMGQVMKVTQGKANPKIVQEMIKTKVRG